MSDLETQIRTSVRTPMQGRALSAGARGGAPEGSWARQTLAAMPIHARHVARKWHPGCQSCRPMAKRP